jgi:pSer/pThr/pTyr-binding forkhead associated (FHA) protein
MNVSGWLTVVKGPKVEGSFHIRQPVLTIGRAPTNLIQIVHASVSRRHAQLRRIDGEIHVTDLKSRNGTWINGDRISSTQILKNNDMLQVGDVLMQYVVNPDYKEDRDLVMERKNAGKQCRILETEVHEMDEDIFDNLK